MRTRLRSSAAILSNNFDGARFAALRADHLDACSASSDGPGIRVTCNLFGRAHDATGPMHEIGSGRARRERAGEPTQSRSRSIAGGDRGTESGFWSG